MGSLINFEKYDKSSVYKRGVTYSVAGSNNMDMAWEFQWGQRMVGVVHGNMRTIGSWECSSLLKVE